MADEEANVARVMQDDVGNVGSEFVSSVSLTAVKAMVRRLVLDPPQNTRELLRFTAETHRWTGEAAFFPLPPAWTERRQCFWHNSVLDTACVYLPIRL